MHHGDGNLVQADIKPTIESADMAVQQWTPSKRMIMSPTTMQPVTPPGIKMEVCTVLLRKFIKSVNHINIGRSIAMKMKMASDRIN